MSRWQFRIHDNTLISARLDIGFIEVKLPEGELHPTIPSDTWTPRLEPPLPYSDRFLNRVAALENGAAVTPAGGGMLLFNGFGRMTLSPRGNHAIRGALYLWTIDRIEMTSDGLHITCSTPQGKVIDTILHAKQDRQPLPPDIFQQLVNTMRSDWIL